LSSEFLRIGIYWGSLLVIPWTVFLFWLWKKKKDIIPRVFLSALFFLTALFVWARFVEPQLIVVRQTHIPSSFKKDILLIGDLHLGIYKTHRFLERAVQKINAIDADMVLIAGDFVNHSSDLKKDFAPLEKLNKPTFVVFGNHDAGIAGGNAPDVRDSLEKVLTDMGIKVLQNEIVSFDDFVLVGLGSRWASNDRVEILNASETSLLSVVLTHNPDTTLLYSSSANADFTFVGHTHCGQIRIPYFYKKVIPTMGDFDKGLTTEKHTTLFITCGLGEVGLPMRFLNPPVIDILRFHAFQ
jgi:predicted MPP superfamily phosphohydrolase